MWKKVLITIFLFCLFALLQTNFFPHFSLFGAIPNLVFVLFFLLAFFVKQENHYQIFALALVSGFFLDIFSFTYIGPSIIVLIVVGYLLKQTQLLLKSMDESYPFVYFLPLFIIFFIANELLIDSYFYFLDSSKILMNFNVKFVFSIIYNSFFATGFFYIYTKLISTARSSSYGKNL